MTDSATGPLTTARFIKLFFEELQRCGVGHVCISPGSRSTPLTLAAARTAGLHCSVHLDERSAAFFALGMARRVSAPVVLICTSGTAVANYLPAIIEAGQSGVPLLVLSADRPAELRDCGAGQTIDQLKIYGQQVKRFAEVCVGEAGDALWRFARTLACRSVAEAQSEPAGVVHLNWPLREPFVLIDAEAPLPERVPTALTPVDGQRAVAWTGRPDGDPFVALPAVRSMLDPAALQQLLGWIAACPRGVISCGALPASARLRGALLELARRTGWPLLCDPLSQLRSGPVVEGAPLISCTDWLLANARFAVAQSPQLVLCFGPPPVSKAQRLWLEAQPPERLLLVDPAARFQQPSHLASALYRLAPLSFCEQLLGALDGLPRDSNWSRQWLSAEAQMVQLLQRQLRPDSPGPDGVALTSALLVRELAALLPEGATLWVSNSMPVRELDAYLPARPTTLQALCNRGANGIDGVLSTALGWVAAGPSRQLGPLEPTVLLIGDLALLHDLGALLSVRRLALDITVVVLNNDGGAIFSYLPIAQQAPEQEFEQYFNVAHGLEFRSAAQQFGFDYRRVMDVTDLGQALRTAWAMGGGHLIEVPVDTGVDRRQRRSLARQFDQCWQAASDGSETVGQHGGA